MNENKKDVAPYLAGFFLGVFMVLAIIIILIGIKGLVIVDENALVLLDEDKFYVGEVFAKGEYDGQYEYLVEVYDLNDSIIIVISDDPFITLNTEVIIYFDGNIAKIYEGGN